MQPPCLRYFIQEVWIDELTLYRTNYKRLAKRINLHDYDCIHGQLVILHIYLNRNGFWNRGGWFIIWQKKEPRMFSKFSVFFMSYTERIAFYIFFSIKAHIFVLHIVPVTFLMNWSFIHFCFVKLKFACFLVSEHEICLIG